MPNFIHGRAALPRRLKPKPKNTYAPLHPQRQRARPLQRKQNTSSIIQPFAGGVAAFPTLGLWRGGSSLGMPYRMLANIGGSPAPRVGTIQDQPLGIAANTNPGYQLNNGGVLLCAKSKWNLTGIPPAGSSNPHNAVYFRPMNIASPRDGYGFNELAAISKPNPLNLSGTNYVQPLVLPNELIFSPTDIVGAGEGAAAIGELGFSSVLA
jgi:hypothetical protein